MESGFGRVDASCLIRAAQLAVIVSSPSEVVLFVIVTSFVDVLSAVLFVSGTSDEDVCVTMTMFLICCVLLSA